VNPNGHSEREGKTAAVRKRGGDTGLEPRRPDADIMMNELEISRPWL